MTPPSPREYLLSHMTWPEAREAMSRAPLAIIPTGAVEQHGTHLALDTDVVRADGFCRRLAEELAPNAVVTPCIAPGVSSHHMDFPGTLSVSPETFIQTLYEVITSLYRHGWRTFFVVNGHGGNAAPSAVAISRLQADFDDIRIASTGITSLVNDLVRDFTVGPRAAHSSEIETSQTMYLAEDRVRPERIDEMRAEDPVRFPRVAASHGIKAPLPFHKVSPDGATGTPSASTRDTGRILVETAVERATTFLREFIAH